DNTVKTVIVKFSQDVPMTINFADQMLTRKGIPVPKSLALSLTDSKARKVRTAIWRKLKSDTQARKRIDEATTIMAFEEVERIGSHGTVGSILFSFKTGDYGNSKPPPDVEDMLKIKQVFANNPSRPSDLTSQQRRRVVGSLKSVRALVGCVADPNQAQ